MEMQVRKEGLSLNLVTVTAFVFFMEVTKLLEFQRERTESRRTEHELVVYVWKKGREGLPCCPHPHMLLCTPLSCPFSLRYSCPSAY